MNCAVRLSVIAGALPSFLAIGIIFSLWLFDNSILFLEELISYRCVGCYVFKV